MIDLSTILATHYPPCWKLERNDYDTLVWLSNEIPKPTLAELEALITPQQRRDAMAAAFDALPISVQATFYVTRVAAEVAMDKGRYDIARAIVEAQQVSPELEATKAAILSHFPA